MSQQPKVSVAIITYCHERFIAQAIQSVLDQETDFELEIVIGDDCSTDGTRDILNELQGRHPNRIRLLLHDTNLGANRNAILTLAACRGQYIALLEGDDFWTDPTKLQRQIDFLDENPSCVICCHKVEHVDQDGNRLGRFFPEDIDRITTIDRLIEKNFIQTCSVVVRAGIVNELPRWFQTLHVGDYPFFMLHAQHGDIGFLGEVLAAYRVHPESFWSGRSNFYHLKETIRALRFLKRDLREEFHPQINRALSDLHWEIFFTSHKAGRQRRADRHRYLCFLYGGCKATWSKLPKRTLVNLWLRRWPPLHKIVLFAYNTQLRLQRLRPKITVKISFTLFVLKTALTDPWSMVRAFHRIRSQGIEGVRAVNRELHYFFGHRNSTYRRWIRKHEALRADDRHAIRLRVERMEAKPVITIVMPVYNVAKPWLRKAIESVRQQIYPHWELCIADDASTASHIRPMLEEYQRLDSRIRCVFREKNGHISAASNSALELATGDFVALLDHDDKLPEHALYMVAEEINRHPDVDLIYSDEDKIDTRGRRFEPYFKSDFNPDLVLSQNMICHLGVFRTQLMRDVGGFREGYEGGQDHDLALRVIEKSRPERIRHIPHVLYHWRAVPSSVTHTADSEPTAYDAGMRAIRDHLSRQDVRADVSIERGRCAPHYRVRYELPDELPLVSIIIPTKDKLDLLSRCVDGLLNATDYPNLEVIVVDNNSQRPETRAYFNSVSEDSRVRVLPYEKPFNYSAINNAAVRIARGSLICLLNNDIEVIHGNWLHEMVSHAVRPEVGAVGAKLHYPNDSIQHAGVITGYGGVAGHVHLGVPRDTAVQFARTEVIQNFSAVTAGCLLLRRSIYDEVGGLDEKAFVVRFNDVDFCLKIVDKGYRIVWTPYAELYHWESASLGKSTRPEQHERDHVEIERMKVRWGDRLLNDPFFNPNLSLWHVDYVLSFPPRTVNPWRAAPEPDDSDNT